MRKVFNLVFYSSEVHRWIIAAVLFYLKRGFNYQFLKKRKTKKCKSKVNKKLPRVGSAVDEGVILKQQNI